MSKQTRKQKREEERRILAEMEAAMLEQKGEETPAETDAPKTEEAPKKRRWGQMDDPTPKKLHCRRCNTLLDDKGYCSTCGYKVYMPMDEKKRGKVKLILTIVFVVIFLGLFIGLQIKNS